MPYFELIRRTIICLIYKICEKYIGDKEDLINKATVLALRETEKVNFVIRDFLAKHQGIMRKTMLKYSLKNGQ